jgi:hypothetical protein
MPSIQRKSKPARTTLVLLAMLFTVLAVIAVRPAAGLAAPIEPVEPPQLAFEPGSYDFGLQPVNNGSGQANLQLRNTGTEAAQVNSVEIPGGSEFFWFNTNCNGYWLQPNETCSVQAYFSPRDATEYAAQLRANSGSYSFTADLTGTGGRAMLTPAAGSTDFGVAKVGSAGTIREIAVTNTGNMPGGAFIAVVAGGAVGSFQLIDENCTGIELVPAATCTLQVRFQPVSEGVKKATLGLFGDSDGGAGVILTGVGSAPDPAADQPSASAPTVFTAARPPHRAKRRRHRLRLHRRHGRVALDASRVLTRAR